MVFTDAQKFVDLQKAIEEKNTKLQKDIEEKNSRLQVLVNSLAIENQSMKNETFEMKQRIKDLEKKDKATKNRLDQVLLTLKNLEPLLKELEKSQKP